MMRTINVQLLTMATAVAVISSPQIGSAANLSVWEPASSLIDTTNYNGLAPYYWFANVKNANTVSGQPMNQNQASNLPSWLHFEANPACVGKADDCSTADATNRTGFSFSENTTTGAGATSSGGPGFNTLTLPNGISGSSGEAFDTLNTAGKKSSVMLMRVLAGAPGSVRVLGVTENGPGTQQGGGRGGFRKKKRPPGLRGGSR